MKHKKLLLLIALFVLLCLPCAAQALSVDKIEAEAYMLIDTEDGEVLLKKNADKVLYMASLTKIMTAYLVLQNVSDLDASLTSPKDFVNVGESSAGILPNETHTYRELLYALLVKSANDAAQVLAIGVAGSEKLFVQMMNDTAAALGMKNTHFMNPHGLHHEQHYTTASDMLLLTRKALELPEFREIVATSKITLPWNKGSVTFTSTNKLFGKYEGIMGVKTGTTTPAGSCLIALCERGDAELLAVILKSKDVFSEMPALLDYGFDNFHREQVCEAGDFMGDVAVQNGKRESVGLYLQSGLKLLMRNGVEVKKSIEIPDIVPAPLEKGDVVGKMTVRDSFGNSFVLDIAAGESVAEHTFALSFRKVFDAIFSVFTKRLTVSVPAGA